MAEIDIDIADLESILTNFRADHTEQELQEFEENLAQLNYLRETWDNIRETPVDKAGRIMNDIRVPFRTNSVKPQLFTAGTHFTDIERWFEATFCVSIKDDFTD